MYPLILIKNLIICCIFINKTFEKEQYFDRIQKNLLLKKILDMFHLSNPVKVNNIDVGSIKLLQEKYKSMNNFEENNSDENFSEIKIMGKVVNDFLIEFENSDILEKYEILQSSLFIKYDIPSNDGKIIKGKIQVYDIESPFQIGKTLGSGLMDFGGYGGNNLATLISLNKKHLYEYIKSGRRNLHMMIVPKISNKLLNITINHADLTMKVINRNSRLKRNNKEFSSCEDDGSKDSCCMRSYEVNFDDLKWDFIISPRILKTNYCYGECKKVSKKSTIGNVLSKIQDENVFTYRSCCHPTEYRPLNVTIFINKSIVETKLINDLLVKKCSCY
uniref:TGF_BETA_2 domain-containing protein n=1 Tax=Strongyloides venezuelensis TaxID=75913 RepID=A0A0K0FYI2_STRVS